MVLSASFVRVRGQRDRVYVRRTDGTETSWVFPSYGEGLPHDLVHLVVEAAFGLRRGFWGRVDTGADPARINAEANRAGGADKYRGFGEDRAELLLAEALAGGAWSTLSATHPAPSTEAEGELWASIERNCAHMGVALPEGARRGGAVGEALGVILRLGAAWRAFEEKGTLTLHFRPDDPRRSFVEMIRDTDSGAA
jgi:hypothetical protein